MPDIFKGMNERKGTVGPARGKTVVAQTFTKKSERIDSEGNVIDPETKRIIKPASQL